MGSQVTESITNWSHAWVAGACRQGASGPLSAGARDFSARLMQCWRRNVLLREMM